jgi:hypothetical protein
MFQDFRVKNFYPKTLTASSTLPLTLAVFFLFFKKIMAKEKALQ